MSNLKLLLPLAMAGIASFSAQAIEESNNPFSKILYAKYEYSTPVNGEGSSGILQVGKGIGNWLVRATLPVIQGDGESSIGDANILIPHAWTFDDGILVGAGVNLTLPTHTKDWAGKDAVGVGFGMGYLNPVIGSAFSHSGLLTYSYNVGADTVEDEAHEIKYSPFLYWQLGDGYYLRSTAEMSVDLLNDEYFVPIGLGVGKIVKTDSVSFNFYAEAQQAIFYKGDDFNNRSIMAGLKIDF